MNKQPENKRFIKQFMLFFVILLSLAGWLFHANNPTGFNQIGVVMVASVAMNGKYAVTTNANRELILWNIGNKTKKTISNIANIYSAYFIKNTDDFMWQNDLTNEVIIQNINGDIIKSFNPGFPTYGQVMTSNLQYYFGSDAKWNVFEIHNKLKRKIKQGFDGFFAVGKLLNLSLSNKNIYLLTSGDAGGYKDQVPLSAGRTAREIIPQILPYGNYSLLDGVVLWKVSTGKPLYKLTGNENKTFGTLSPNGKYALTGDETSFLFIWSTKTGKKLLSVPWMNGYIKKKSNGQLYVDNKNFPEMPKYFKNKLNTFVYFIETIKFIDKTHYLRFPYGAPYAILYQVTNPIPIKYFPLSKNPWVAIRDYSRDEATDTSPQAHILVMGKQDKSGIVVYKYNPTNQTLKQIWLGKGLPPKWKSLKKPTGNWYCEFIHKHINFKHKCIIKKNSNSLTGKLLI